MKLAFGLLLLAVSAYGYSINSYSEADDNEWELYKTTYGKYYLPKEDALRRELYVSTKEEVDEHNEQYIEGQYSFHRGINNFSDWNESEQSLLMGYREPEGYEDIDHPLYEPEENVEVHRSIDWRQYGAVTPVKNQGACGSCWAFSAVGSLEGQHMLRTGSLVSLSEQNIMDCDKVDGSCHGGWMTQAFSFVRSNGGVDTEESYPYKGKDSDTCYFRKSFIGATDDGYLNIPRNDERTLEKAVSMVGPISVAINAGGHGFRDYAGGVYFAQDCNPRMLNHGVLLVGFGETETGLPYWIIKNSWGPKWGDEGYIKMLKGTNMCGIAAAASFPLV